MVALSATGSGSQWTAPKSVQAKAKSHLHDIWQVETEALAKLVKDRDVPLSFYDFPVEHGQHIRSTSRGFARSGLSWSLPEQFNGTPHPDCKRVLEKPRAV